MIKLILKNIFIVFILSIIHISCSNDNSSTINSQQKEIKELSKNEITNLTQNVQNEFTTFFKYFPKNYRFQKVDWNSNKLIYKEKFTYIIYKTFNDKGINEFNLIIVVNKNLKTRYFLRSLIPQIFESSATIEDNSISQHYSLQDYKNISNIKKSTGNLQYSTRSTERPNPCDEYTSEESINGCHEVILGGGGGNKQDEEEVDDWDWNPEGGGAPDAGSGSAGGGGDSPVVTVPSPEDKVIIDKTFEDNECVKDIYDRLGGTEIGKRFIDPFKLNTDISLTYKITPIDRPVNAVTTNRPNNRYEVNLNKNNIKRSKVEIANTILHETIHANILAYFNSRNINFPKDNPEFGPMWDEYISLSLQEQLNLQANGINDFHHEYMATKYVDVLVKGMKDFLGPNSNYTDDDLEIIAWGGLHNTKAFQLLPTSKKNNFEYKYERVAQKGRSSSCN